MCKKRQNRYYVCPIAAVFTGGECGAAESVVSVSTIRTKAKIRPADRLLWCFIAKFWSGWRAALYFVQPRTVTTWQKKRFRDYWRALSQPAKAGRPRISRELRKLIRRMWEANPTWGSPKIVAELAMLGIDVAKSTVEKYQPKRAGPPSPTWRTFLDQHVRDLVSIDFFIVPTVRFRVLFVFVVLAHDRRRIVHFNVTEHPTAQWTAQQIVEAFPFDTAPSYLIRDGDGIYGERVTRRIESLGIDEVITAPASPWQNAYVERVIGTLRRELFDHVIVLNERHIKRAYVVVSGLLPSMANTPVLEQRRAGRSSRTSIAAWERC